MKRETKKVLYNELFDKRGDEVYYLEIYFDELKKIFISKLRSQNEIFIAGHEKLPIFFNPPIDENLFNKKKIEDIIIKIVEKYKKDIPKKSTTRKDAESKALELAGLKQPEEIFKQQGQVKFYVAAQPIFYDKNDLWWVWNKEEKKWELSNEVDILNHIEKLTGEDIITPKNRTLILNSLKQECRKTIPKPIKPTWIQFKDKIFDIKEGTSFDAIPDYFVTNPIPWELHNSKYEQTPIMDKIFEEWVGKDYVKTLHEIIAYCLLPDYPIHRLFCFIGEGLNGKTCFLRLLKKFVGKSNVTSIELDTLLSSKFEITRLYKKLVCIMGETNFAEISKTSIIKKLTGQDLIGYEYKFKNPFEGSNYAKILIATNNLPTTTDKTIGFYRRWCIIDFPNKFSEEIDILETIPDEEYESLALKSITILKDLLEKRKFHKEGTIEERMEKYEAKSDFLQKFLGEFTKENIDGWISKADFRKKFGEWCIENRHRQMAENTLSKKLKDKGIEISRKYAEWLYEGRGGQMYVYLGLKWKWD